MLAKMMTMIASVGSDFICGEFKSPRSPTRSSPQCIRLNRTLSPRDLNIVASPTLRSHAKYQSKSDRRPPRYRVVCDSVSVGLARAPNEIARRPPVDAQASRENCPLVCGEATSFSRLQTQNPELPDVSINNDSIVIKKTIAGLEAVHAKSSRSDRRTPVKRISKPCKSNRLKRAAEAERLATEVSIHGMPALNQTRQLRNRVSMQPEPTQDAVKPPLNGESGFSAPFFYEQPIFQQRRLDKGQPLSQPCPSDQDQINSNLFALENDAEFDRACAKQLSIEVPNWRVLDERQLRRQLSARSSAARGTSAKEDTTDYAYQARHSKLEADEIRREKRCMELQQTVERLASLEERERKAWAKRQPGRHECSHEVEAERFMPSQLTLSPYKIKRIRVCSGVPIVAFGASLSQPPEKFFKHNMIPKRGLQ